MQDLGDNKAGAKPAFRVWHSKEHDGSRTLDVPAMNAVMEPAIFSALFSAPGHRCNTCALVAGHLYAHISPGVPRTRHPIAWADPPEACGKLNQQVKLACDCNSAS